MKKLIYYSIIALLSLSCVRGGDKPSGGHNSGPSIEILGANDFSDPENIYLDNVQEITYTVKVEDVNLLANVIIVVNTRGENEIVPVTANINGEKEATFTFTYYVNDNAEIKITAKDQTDDENSKSVYVTFNE